MTAADNAAEDPATPPGFRGEWRRAGSHLFGRIDDGVDLTKALCALAHEAGFTTAFVVSAIGKLDNVELGYSQGMNRYDRIRLNETMQIVSLQGNLMPSAGEVDAHLHVALADAEHRARSGHFFEGRVKENVEFVLIILPDGAVERRADPESHVLRMSFNE